MNKSERFAVLDGWRGVCALMVALFHFESNGWLRNTAPIGHAYVLVDFFFILSGFVITHAYEQRLEKGGAGDYLLRRIARIWPLHVVVLLAFIGLELAKFLVTGDGFQGDHALSRIPLNLFLLHSLGFETALTWNFPSWSISVELAMYVSFIAFVLVPRRLRLPVALASVLASLAILAVVAPYNLITTFEFGPLRGVAGFYTGYLVYHLYRRFPLRVGTLGELACLAMILGFISVVSVGRSSLLTPLVFGVAVYVFASEGGAVSTALRSPVGSALAKWSYSIYMLHAFFIVSIQAAVGMLHPSLIHYEEGFRLVGPPLLMDLASIAFLGLVCLTASVTYRLIEMPAQKLVVDWMKRRRQAQDAIAA